MHPRPIARKCRFLLWSVSPHMPLRHYGKPPGAIGVDAQQLKTNPSHRKKGLGREKREEKRASQEVVNKTMAALHFMVLKAIHHNGPTVRLPACISVEGIKPMPNSLMSMDVEEWAIIKSHRQTAGDHSHLCTIRCCEVGIASSVQTQDIIGFVVHQLKGLESISVQITFLWPWWQICEGDFKGRHNNVQRI